MEMVCRAKPSRETREDGDDAPRTEEKDRQRERERERDLRWKEGRKEGMQKDESFKCLCYVMHIYIYIYA